MAKQDIRTLKTKTGKRGGARRNAGRKTLTQVAIAKGIAKDPEEYSKKMVIVLVTLALDEDVEPQYRISAADKALNRLIGLPKQQEAAKVDVTHKADASFAAALEKVYGPIANRLGVA